PVLRPVAGRVPPGRAARRPAAPGERPDVDALAGPPVHGPAVPGADPGGPGRGRAEPGGVRVRRADRADGRVAAAALRAVRLAGAGVLSVTIDVAGAIGPDQLDGLAAAIDGRPVPLTRTRIDGIHRFAGRVPAAGAGGGRYRLDVRVPRTARPCDTVPGS